MLKGQNRLAAIALLFLNEEDAFWCLLAITEFLMPVDYYSRTLSAAQVDQVSFILAGFPQKLENLENENGHGKVMEHEKIGQKSWNFVISHRILPILPPSYTKFLFVLITAKILSSNLESALSDVFNKMLGMQNQEERWSRKIKKWSWKNILSSLWEP